MSTDDNKVTYFAQTDSRNRRTPFGIKRKDRSRHTYVIGKTGMGKSTLLENMAIQDIQNGEGIAFIDPHGKTAELLLEYVPEHRIKDVLYFAPFDMDYPISFNVMEDVGPDKRHLVVNGLMSTFEKIWVDAWSARMAYILSNTLLALLEYPGSTLLGINRMLADKDFRKLVVANIKDPSVRSFWVDEFGKYTDKYAAEATPAIQNKVGQFTSNPLIRNIVGQPTSSFDMRKIMDEKKIMIINLSKGRVGEGNANLLGSMLITKIYLAAMSRADASEVELNKLPNFYLYVDEFQSFANKSFADILSEARKYKLNLTIAHQYIEQMEEEVRAAVFGNVGTMVTFRVGAYDAEVLEKEFAPQFTAEDLVNLGVYQIYLKLMIDSVGSAPFSATTMAPIEKPAVSHKDAIIASSRAQFGAPRAKVEEGIQTWHAPIVPVVVKKIEKPAEKIELKKEEPAKKPSTPAPVALPTISASGSKLKADLLALMPKLKPAILKPQIDSRPVRAVTPTTQAPVFSTPKKNPTLAVSNSPSPISLNQLKAGDQQKKPKTIGKENLDELRKALSSLLKAKEVPAEVVPQKSAAEKNSVQPTAARQEKVAEPKKVEEVPPQKEKKTKEVPESVLRDLLKVDHDERS
ncbi:MAG: type IV secretion system DNA-binding domain-containing protein [Patescibacteria group bacterium]